MRAQILTQASVHIRIQNKYTQTYIRQTLLAKAENRINVLKAFCIAAKFYVVEKKVHRDRNIYVMHKLLDLYNCIHLGEIIY